ncbi:MAG TPA: hypothetical protein VFX91_07340 [Alcanivorax sp.]|nr:hypothetical protein [Alcanivorax sp.]
MKPLVVITLLLTVTGLAQAVPPQNPVQVNAMIAELESLHQKGVELHSDYDAADKAQLKACQAEHAGLGAQATELRARAAKLPELAYRVNLTMAANDAVGCVSCTSDGSDCDAIPAALKRVDRQMKAGGPAG